MANPTLLITRPGPDGTLLAEKLGLEGLHAQLTAAHPDTPADKATWLMEALHASNVPVLSASALREALGEVAEGRSPLRVAVDLATRRGFERTTPHSADLTQPEAWDGPGSTHGQLLAAVLSDPERRLAPPALTEYVLAGTRLAQIAAEHAVAQALIERLPAWRAAGHFPAGGAERLRQRASELRSRPRLSQATERAQHACLTLATSRPELPTLDTATRELLTDAIRLEDKLRDPEISDKQKLIDFTEPSEHGPEPSQDTLYWKAGYHERAWSLGNRGAAFAVKLEDEPMSFQLNGTSYPGHPVAWNRGTTVHTDPSVITHNWANDWQKFPFAPEQLTFAASSADALAHTAIFLPILSSDGPFTLLLDQLFGDLSDEAEKAAKALGKSVGDAVPIPGLSAVVEAVVAAVIGAALRWVAEALEKVTNLFPTVILTHVTFLDGEETLQSHATLHLLRSGESTPDAVDVGVQRGNVVPSDRTRLVTEWQGDSKPATVLAGAGTPADIWWALVGRSTPPPAGKNPARHALASLPQGMTKSAFNSHRCAIRWAPPECGLHAALYLQAGESTLILFVAANTRQFPWV